MAKQVSEGSLHKWFKGSKSKDGKGGWVNVVTGGTCASDEPGEGTPKCVSSAKRASMTKAERLSAARRKKKADPGQQQKSGAAKPTYVSTDSPRKKKKKKMNEGWSDKYKQSIDCDNPKGFSQKAHCQGKKKMKETYQRSLTPLTEKAKKCWPGYEKKGTKKMFGKTYNNCVKKEEVEVIESKGHKYDDSFIEGETGSKRARRDTTAAMNRSGMGYGKLGREQQERRERHKADRGKKTKGTKGGHSGSAYPQRSHTMDTMYPHKKKARLERKVRDKKSEEKKSVPESNEKLNLTDTINSILSERLGGRGVSQKAAAGSIYPGEKGDGQTEDQDRGAGNKAARRSGKEVKEKSPTYLAYVKNKKKVDEAVSPNRFASLLDKSKNMNLANRMAIGRDGKPEGPPISNSSPNNTNTNTDVKFPPSGGGLTKPDSEVTGKNDLPNTNTDTKFTGNNTNTNINKITGNTSGQNVGGLLKNNTRKLGSILKKSNTSLTTSYEIEGDTLSEVKDKKGKGSGKKDACYHKVKSRYSVWPSAYASGALVKCRKVGAANWGNSSKKESFSDWKSEFIWEGQDSSKKIEEKIQPGVKGDGFLGPTVGGLGIPNPIRITKDVVDTVNRKNKNTVDRVNKELPGSAKMGKFKEFNPTVSTATTKLLGIKNSYEPDGEIVEGHYGKAVNKIPKELDKAVALHKSQAKRLRDSDEFKKDAGKSANKIPGQLDKAVAMHTKQAKQLRSAGVGEKNCGCGKTPCKTYGKKKEMKEDWQKTNRQDKTDGMSQKAVNAYKRENPGSKLKTAVTKKPSSLKRGSKDAKRRKSFCSRMKGMKKRLTSAKTARDPDSRINKALRRWNC